MTNLGYSRVAETKDNSIMLSVSGDLSYSYAVVPKGEYTTIGLAFTSKERALDFSRKTGKLGWSKQIEIYRKQDLLHKQTFRYLPKHMAVKYLKYAYGDYAERLRRGG